MIPQLVALALQADGWWLRSDIIWQKTNPLPESVKDRPTKSHEHVFLLAKSERYFYDNEAVAEPCTDAGLKRLESPNPPLFGGKDKHDGYGTRLASGNAYTGNDNDTRNRRDVWTMSTSSYPGAHFAVMPNDLAEVCILAGSAEGDTVLDPFGGAGTTGLVADRLGRDAILIELNPEYCELAERRIKEDAGMWAEVEMVGAAS